MRVWLCGRSSASRKRAQKGGAERTVAQVYPSTCTTCSQRSRTLVQHTAGTVDFRARQSSNVCFGYALRRLGQTRPAYTSSRLCLSANMSSKVDVAAKLQRRTTPDHTESQLPMSTDELECARAVLEKQDQRAVPMCRTKLENIEKYSTQTWERFFRRNEDRFYRDRRWLRHVFVELADACASALTGANQVHLLEVGCGVGNTIAPLLEEYPSLRIEGLDCSSTALQLARVRSQKENWSARCNFTLTDITKSLPSQLLSSVDFASLMFCLSALPPKCHQAALQNIFQALKPNGLLYFRDYGVYDMAMLRFKSENKLGHCYYRRGDGTTAFFFDIDTLKHQLEDCGFKIQHACYHRRTVVNTRRDISMKRVWAFVKAQKPP